MGAFCDTVLLLLAVLLHCANSSSVATTAKEGEKAPVDCSPYIIRPEDIEKMAKCINQAIIDQIIKNITDTTNGKIKAIEESELPNMSSSFTKEIEQLKNKVLQLEKSINSSQAHWKHNCRQDCLDWRSIGFHSSGIYQVCPDNGQPIVVYCDMETDGGGWVVFQHRADGSTNFTRRWLDYKMGFGDLNGDFWLGFEKIRRFMKVPNKLRIDLVAYNQHGNIKGYGKYNNFNIGDEDSYFMLNVSDFTGTISDRLDNVNYKHRSSGASFSTYDRDHDNDLLNCARSWNGGYWYNYCNKNGNFPYTMLNGVYHKYGVLGSADPNEAYNGGMFWYGWPSSQHKFRGLTKTKLMFKRKY